MTVLIESHLLQCESRMSVYERRDLSHAKCWRIIFALWEWENLMIFQNGVTDLNWGRYNFSRGSLHLNYCQALRDGESKLGKINGYSPLRSRISQRADFSAFSHLTIITQRWKLGEAPLQRVAYTQSYDKNSINYASSGWGVCGGRVFAAWQPVWRCRNIIRGKARDFVEESWFFTTLNMRSM